MASRLPSDRVSKTVLLAVLGLINLLLSSPLHAQGTPTQVIFGPHQYVRTTGAPNQYNDTFTLPVAVGPPFLMTIVNGNPDGTNRLSDATVTLNGVQVAGSSDFSQTVAELDRTVTVQTGNTLQVTTASIPTGFLTIRVFGTSLSVPTALTPNPLTLIAGTTGTLTATLAPAPTAAGTLSASSDTPSVASVPASVAFSAGQTSVTVPVTAGAAGTARLTVTLNGVSAGSTVTVVIPPPTITGVTPASGRVGETVTVTGANFVNVQTVAFNELPASSVTVTSASALTATVPPLAKTGPLTVTTAQGTATSPQPFTVLNSPPTLTPLGPQTVPLGTTLNLTVTATDPDGDPVSFALTPLPLPPHATFNSQTGQFIFTPDATQVGTISLTVVATDGMDASAEPLTLTVTGVPAGGVTGVAGRIVGGSGTPLANVPVTLKATGQQTVTDAQGAFTLTGVPSGRQQLRVDGFAQGYAILVAPVDLILNVTTQVASPFTLPPIDTARAVPINPSATTVVSNPNLPGVSVTIAAGSATQPDGTLYRGSLSISPVPEYGRPESRPVELRPGLAITIQPAGITLEPPAPLTFPNVDQLAPGNELDLWSLSPDTGTFLQVGTLQVSADGQRLETISGGVRKTAWHFPLPPDATPATAAAGVTAGTCTACPLGSEADLDEGALAQDLVIPGVRTLGVSRALTLHYRSTSADVRPILPIDATLSVRAAVPRTFSARLTVGGVQQGPEVYWDSSGLPETADSVSRLGVQFDASALGTGRYPYELMLFSNYPQSSIGGAVTRQVLVRNERGSPFGAGWTLTGLDWLLPQADGSLVLAKGAGDTALFGQARPLVIESLDLTRSDTVDGISTSVLTGPAYAQARADLLDPAQFGPGGLVPRSVTFRSGLAAITLQALTGVDVFILNRLALTPSPTEALALDTFVQGGGALLEMRDFGANRPEILGTLPGGFVCEPRPALTAEGLASALVQGPFGSAAAGVTTGCSAAYATDGLGLEIARTSAGPNILQLPPGTLFSGQGRAVLIGDEEIFASGLGPTFNNLYGVGANRTFFRNLMAYLAGEPAGPFPSPVPNTLAVYQGPPGEFSILVQNLDGTYTRTLPDGTTQHFTARGLQTAVTDRNGNTTTYAYDGSGRLTTLTDPVGQVTTFSYTGGQLATITDPAGRVTQFQHDAAGNLTTVTAADHSQVTFAYDPQHRLTQRTDARGAVSQYQYDYTGRLSQVTLPTGETRRLTPNQRSAVPNPAAGQGTQTNPAPLAPPVSSATFQDGRGHVTTFQLDAFSRLLQQTDALGRVTTIQRDRQGNPTSITRPNGAVTTMTYDAKGNRLTTTEQAIAATTTFTYEPTFNQVTSITDPKGNRTQLAYDAHGNPTTLTDAAHQVTTFAYDSRGLLISTTAALNQTTTFTYDAVGRLLTTTDALNRTTTLTYEAAGNMATSTDALGRVTSFEYDALNRLKTMTDPAGGITEYTYDGNGNLTSVKDAKNQTTTFAYDPLNRLASTTDSLGKTETDTYDGADNLLTRVTPKQDTISFAYDVVNQLTSKTLPGSLVTSYTYDQVGNLLTVTDPDSALTMTYDLANRLLTTSTASSPNQPAVTLTATYDKTGNRLTLADPTGSTSYGYDVLNRLTSLTSPAGAFTYAYDALSRRTSLTRPNGTQTTYTYDPASEVTQILHQITATSTPINQAAYTYNLVGNRTSLTDRRGTQAFGYDALDRLASASHPLLATPESFAYDPVGNRTTNGSVVNAGNQLTEDAQFTYAYDANGNLITKTDKATGNVTQYAYDAESRLVQVQDFTAGNPTPTTTSTYRYDGLGRRIEKVANGQTRRYVYDQEDILLEYDGSNVLQARYTHGPGIDEPIAITRGGVTYYYHQDGLGTVTDLTDSTGSTAQAYAYDAWGNILQQTGTIETPYTYTGREFDADAGLYYYRARYYNPTVGRFLQRDSLRGEVRKGRNLYPYARNNPLRFTDPSGLQGVEDCKYYDDLCKRSQLPCMSLDSYACKAGDCCRDFGEGPITNQIRSCLINIDHICTKLPDSAQQRCRDLAHTYCYGVYELPETWPPPQSCRNIGLFGGILAPLFRRKKAVPEKKASFITFLLVALVGLFGIHEFRRVFVVRGPKFDIFDTNFIILNLTLPLVLLYTPLIFLLLLWVRRSYADTIGFTENKMALITFLMGCILVGFAQGPAFFIPAWLQGRWANIYHSSYTMGWCFILSSLVIFPLGRKLVLEGGFSWIALAIGGIWWSIDLLGFRIAPQSFVWPFLYICSLTIALFGLLSLERYHRLIAFIGLLVISSYRFLGSPFWVNVGILLDPRIRDLNDLVAVTAWVIVLGWGAGFFRKFGHPLGRNKGVGSLF